MAKLRSRLPGKGVSRVYGYVTCSECNRLVADHTYEEAGECAALIEADQKKPGWRHKGPGAPRKV